VRDFDYAAAADFLSLLFSETREAVEIRALPNEYGAGPARPLFTRDPDLVQRHCEKWDDLGRAVYFGVATRASGTAKGDRAHVRELPALWADIDCYKLGISTDTAVAALLSFSIPPSAIVLSGGGVHGYWLLSCPLDVSQADPTTWPAIELAAVGALKQLAGVFAGDLAVCDLARVMRLPGTHNTKDGTLRACEVLPCSTWACVDFDELVEQLFIQGALLVQPPAMRPEIAENPWLAHAGAFNFGSATDAHELLAKMHYEDPEYPINKTQFSAVGKFIYRNVPDDEIVKFVLEETYRAAAEKGREAFWNWDQEESQIRDMIARTDRTFVPESNIELRGSAKVIELRAGGAKPAPKPPKVEEDPAPAPGTFARNDFGNAQTLISRHGADLRYVLGLGWHHWDGKRYALDAESVATRKIAYDVANDMLREAAASPSGSGRKDRVKWAISSGNSGRISGTLDASRSYLFAKSDDLDADNWLLNCQNGTLDLRTGGLRPHAHADLITKICATNYDPNAQCPTWEKFLSTIFNHDLDMVDFMYRALGYSLTGSTKEQCVFILHGTGSNGKSVLLETIAALLHDYVKSAPSTTFAQKDNPPIPNDVAMLAGARFVSVIETEHGKHLAEGLVKQATGGDRMPARFLHKEWFEFTPKFKLWFATNHKPLIRGSDYAIWRRIRLIPFSARFVDADKVEGNADIIKDPEIKAKLAIEFPGILAWLVRGCQAWQQIGMKPPVAVEEATQGYMESQDNTSKFITEWCHVGRGIECDVGLLYAAYVFWCAEDDYEPLSKRAFGLNLEERGIMAGRSGKARERVRKGIAIKGEFEAAAQAAFAAQQAKSTRAADAADAADATPGNYWNS
jgi:putative DNA primase/helicase